jgi:hypothetical protein
MSLFDLADFATRIAIPNDNLVFSAYRCEDDVALINVTSELTGSYKKHVNCLPDLKDKLKQINLNPSIYEEGDHEGISLKTDHYIAKIFVGLDEQFMNSSKKAVSAFRVGLIPASGNLISSLPGFNIDPFINTLLYGLWFACMSYGCYNIKKSWDKNAGYLYLQSEFTERGVVDYLKALQVLHSFYD